MDANLRSRLATAGVGIPMLVWLIGWGPPWLFSTVFFLFTAGALYEYFAMTLPGAWKQRLAGNVIGAALAFAVIRYGQSAALQYLGAALVLALSAILVFRQRLVKKINLIVWTLLGVFYIGYLVPFVILLFRRPDGRAWTAWLLFVIMAGDSAGYFVGRRFGKKKLAPALSPGKTVAGAWGNLLGALIVGLMGAALLLRPVSWLEIALLSLALAVLGQIGDLFESWIKRVSAVKDSGSVLPGHGGLLDRLDSLIFPAAFTTAYLRMFHS
ncbi:MAG: phosphatidate cytidylyltransferase [Candidatus Binatia bacterium]